jgi:hypothetical protein
MPYICQKRRLEFAIVTAPTAVLRTAGRLLLCYKSRLTRTSTGLVERLGDLPDIQQRIHALPSWVQKLSSISAEAAEKKQKVDELTGLRWYAPFAGRAMRRLARLSSSSNIVGRTAR